MAMLVQIEYCRNCSLHNWNSHHDEVKYLDFYEQLSRKIKEHIPDAKIIERKPTEELVLRKIQANDGALYINKQTGQPVHFPRLGSFQIYVDGVRIFSKLKSKIWPKFTNIMQKLDTILQAKDQGRSFITLDVDYTDQKPIEIRNADRYDIKAIFRVRKSLGKDQSAFMHQTTGRQGFRQRQLQRSLDVEKGANDVNPEYEGDIVFEEARERKEKETRQWLDKWKPRDPEAKAKVYLQELYPRAQSRRRKLVISKIDSNRILLENEKGERIAYRKQIKNQQADQNFLESGASSVRGSSRRNNRRKLVPIDPTKTKAKINEAEQQIKDEKYGDLYDQLNLSDKERVNLQKDAASNGKNQDKQKDTPKKKEIVQKPFQNPKQKHKAKQKQMQKSKKISQNQQQQYEQQFQQSKQKTIPNKSVHKTKTIEKQESHHKQQKEIQGNKNKDSEKDNDNYSNQFIQQSHEQQYQKNHGQKENKNKDEAKIMEKNESDEKFEEQDIENQEVEEPEEAMEVIEVEEIDNKMDKQGKTKAVVKDEKLEHKQKKLEEKKAQQKKHQQKQQQVKKPEQKKKQQNKTQQKKPQVKETKVQEKKMQQQKTQKQPKKQQAQPQHYQPPMYQNQKWKAQYINGQFDLLLQKQLKPQPKQKQQPVEQKTVMEASYSNIEYPQQQWNAKYIEKQFHLISVVQKIQPLPQQIKNQAKNQKSKQIEEQVHAKLEENKTEKMSQVEKKVEKAQTKQQIKQQPKKQSKKEQKKEEIPKLDHKKPKQQQIKNDIPKISDQIQSHQKQQQHQIKSTEPVIKQTQKVDPFQFVNQYEQIVWNTFTKNEQYILEESNPKTESENVITVPIKQQEKPEKQQKEILKQKQEQKTEKTQQYISWTAAYIKNQYRLDKTEPMPTP